MDESEYQYILSQIKEMGSSGLLNLIKEIIKELEERNSY